MCKLRLIFCILQWCLAFLCSIYYIYINPQIKYDIVSYVCIVSHQDNNYSMIYSIIIDIVLPFLIIIVIYKRLYRYVYQLDRSPLMILANIVEFRMIKCLIFQLIILELGLISRIIFEKKNPSPDYKYRIYYMILSIVSFCFLICTFIFTPQVNQYLIRFKNKLNIRIHPQLNPSIENRY